MDIQTKKTEYLISTTGKKCLFYYAIASKYGQGVVCFGGAKTKEEARKNLDYELEKNKVYV